MGKKEVVRPEGMLNTNGEAVELPFPVQWDNFSFTPVIHSNSWDWGKQPSDPNSGRFRLQFIEWDHVAPRGGYILCALEGLLTWADGAHSHTESHGLGWVIFLDVWNTQDPTCNCEDYGLANWGQLSHQRFPGGHLDGLGAD